VLILGGVLAAAFGGWVTATLQGDDSLRTAPQLIEVPGCSTVVMEIADARVDAGQLDRIEVITNRSESFLSIRVNGSSAHDWLIGTADQRQVEEQLLGARYCLVEVANGAGLATTALITDMNEPLASAAGNALEVVNAVDFLTGRVRDPRLEDVTLALAAQMLVAARLSASQIEGEAMARRALDSGKAAEIFDRMVAALGGPTDFVANCRRHLPEAPIIRAGPSPTTGFVTDIDTRAVGVTVVALGGGRVRPGDAIDPAVGLSGLASVASEVQAGDPLAMVHARNEASAAEAIAAVEAAYTIGDKRPPRRKSVLRHVGAG
jgi:thymidine phosphorylase